MCRWIAYIGQPIYMDTVVIRPAHSLVEQSFNAKMHYKPDGSVLTTNGDGFGIGWYMDKATPGLFKVADPAWSNENINELCTQVTARIFMAHIRAASSGAIQRSNAHPFKYKNWLFQHNGRLLGFDTMRRQLQFDIAPELYSHLRGTTDSETLFLLALTYGLESNPKEAIEKLIMRIKSVCKEHSIATNLTLSCALSDGDSLYTIRYAIGEKSNSQFYSSHAECMSDTGDDYTKLPENSVVVVSEPLNNHTGRYWTEMPDNSFATIRDGHIDITALKV